MTPPRQTDLERAYIQLYEQWKLDIAKLGIPVSTFQATTLSLWFSEYMKKIEEGK